LNVASHTDHAALVFLEVSRVMEGQDFASLAITVQQRTAQHLQAVCLCQPTAVLLVVSVE
jgi:hypothetical protein